MLTYLGAPLGYPHVTASMLLGATGVLFVIGNAALYRRLGGSIVRILPWAALSLFVLLCTAATTFGRAAAGVEQALSSRYHIFSALFWLIVVVMAVLTVEQVRAHAPATADSRALHSRIASITANAGLLAAIVGCQVFANGAGLRDALIWQDAQRGAETQVRDYATAPDSCLLLYHPTPAVIRPLLAFLASEHLAIFAWDDHTSDSARGTSVAAPCDKPYHFIDDAGNAGMVMRGESASRYAVFSRRSTGADGSAAGAERR